MPALKIKLRLQELQAIILLLLGWILAKCTQKEKDLWLFSERGTDARDNGYWMFRYVKENHPEINAKYIISKDSEDLTRVDEWKEDLIEYDSIKNWMIIWNAKYLISTHKFGFYPKLMKEVRLLSQIYEKNRSAKIVWLQHGVIIHDHPHCHRSKFNIDLLICGAYTEYNFIKSNFGFEKDIVQYTGLARFDNLHNVNVNKKQILLMPTWRQWLKHEDFTRSEYFLQFQTLLSDKKIHSLLIQNDLQLVFYPHHEIQPYISEFKKLVLPSCITIADKKHHDVQDLLKKSALLITDYSSVFFDFAYMKKPVIYFQFDETRFNSEHYAKGYFDYHAGLGDWTNSIPELLNSLEKLIINNFQIQEKYLAKTNEFFPLHDTKNCKRIYQAIMSC